MTFDELTPELQQAELDREYEHIMTAIIEGVRFDDKANGDDLQARIDAAIQKADDMQTPWFVASYIDDVAGDDIRAMARASAEDAFYIEQTEQRIRVLA